MREQEKRDGGNRNGFSNRAWRQSARNVRLVMRDCRRNSLSRLPSGCSEQKASSARMQPYPAARTPSGITKSLMSSSRSGRKSALLMAKIARSAPTQQPQRLSAPLINHSCDVYAWVATATSPAPDEEYGI